MKRFKIIKNSIKCKVCGEVLESTYTHDFVECSCFKQSKGSQGCACDGGLSYLRRVGTPGTWEDLSETRPFSKQEEAEHERKMAEYNMFDSVRYRR